MKKTSDRGFTLVELLVVIAIISVIASIVVTQLDTARNKGGDSGVLQNLDNLRPVAEIYYVNNNDSYGTWNGGVANTCPTPSLPGTGLFINTDILRGIAAANSAGGGGGTRCMLPNNGGAYAIAVSMKTSGKVYCIDSLNVAKQYTGTLATSISGSASCN